MEAVENKRPREAEGDNSQESKRRRIDQLLGKVAEENDKPAERLQNVTEKVASLVSSPDMFAHTMNQLFRCVFKTGQNNKMGSYSTVVGLITHRVQRLYGNPEGYTKAFEFGDRVMRLTVEMLDRYLAGGVWIKTMVLMKFTADLMHAGVVHPQNMWNVLREIVNEVMSSKNSSNRRDAYCYMVLSTLTNSGKAIADYQETLKERGLTREPVPVEPEDDGAVRSQHHNVDLDGLFENIRDYMNTGRENARHSAQAGERLEASWIEVSQLYDTKWKGCEDTLARQPYSDPTLRKSFVAPIAAPVVTLKRMKARSQKATDKQREKDDPEAWRQSQIQNCATKIANTKPYGDLKEAEKLYNDCVQQKLLSRNVYLAMMSAYCNAPGSHETEVQNVFDTAATQFQVDQLEWSLLLKAYGNTGNEKIFDIYADMKTKSITPNCNILTVMVNACGRIAAKGGGQTDKLTFYLDEISYYKMKPNDTLLCAFLANYRDLGDLDRCLQLFQVFTADYGVEPSEEAYNILRSVQTLTAEKNLSTYRVTRAANDDLVGDLPPADAIIPKKEEPVKVEPDTNNPPEEPATTTVAVPEVAQDKQEEQPQPVETAPPSTPTEPTAAAEPTEPHSGSPAPKAAPMDVDEVKPEESTTAQ